jgi:hypothetical protein
MLRIPAIANRDSGRQFFVLMQEKHFNVVSKNFKKETV